MTETIALMGVIIGVLVGVLGMLIADKTDTLLEDSEFPEPMPRAPYKVEPNKKPRDEDEGDENYFYQ